MRLIAAVALVTTLACATQPKPAPAEDDDLAPGETTAGMKDEKSAEEICAGGVGDMCSALADHTFRKAKTDEQRKKALQYAEKGCSLKDGAGCSIAGWAHEWGKGGAVDLQRALSSYEAGCEIKDGRSCVKAGTLLAFGPMSVRDRARALPFAAKGCAEARDADGCKLEAKLKAEPKASVTNDCKKRKDGPAELSKEEIGSVIKWHSAEIRDCFDRALQQDPKAAGRIEVDWQIDCSGAVTKLTVKESSLPKPVNECVLQNVRAWKFPAPKGGGVADITFPWVLKPSK